MGLLSALGLVKVSEKKVSAEITLEIEKTNHLLNDIDLIKLSLRELLREAEQAENGKAKRELLEMERKDSQILRELKKKGDAQGYQKAKEFMLLVQKILRSDSSDFLFYQHFPELAENLTQELTGLLGEELQEKAKEEEILRDFQELCSDPLLDQNKIKHFFSKYSNFFKAKPHKKIAKQVQALFSEKMAHVSREPGPTLKWKETGAISSRIREYFFSPYFKGLTREYPETEIDIIIALYGSLVTGFASRYSRHPGAPTDSEGISDADLGIVIFNRDFLQKIIRIGPDVLKLIKYDGLYYGPIKENSAKYAGPFSKLFSYLRPLSFAGRNDRKLGIIFVDYNFYKNSLEEEPHQILYKGKIKLH